ncbi:MAG: hypothetical protein Athens071424_68 [Parcubacteria group bacterium Athens0714_24]|nr:MAG: hypothetical protein Athens071424_68 [Parcubacteria group bacterium Athens0714_24]
MKIVKFLIPLTITVLILFFLFSKIDYNEVEKIISESDKKNLFLAVLIFFLPILISALRWKTLMKIAGGDINYKSVLGAYLANIPISKMSPLNSGSFVRAFYFKDKIPVSKNMGIIFLENMLDFMLVSFFVLLGGLILKIKIAVIMGTVVFLSGLCFLIFIPKIKLTINEKWKNKLANFSDVSMILHGAPGFFFLIIFYTFLAWLLVLTCFKFLFLAFGIKISFLYIITSQPIVILLGLIPITISGVGARESIMVYLYHQFAPVSSIVAVGLSYSFLAVILLPLLCLPFLFKYIWK